MQGHVEAAGGARKSTTYIIQPVAVMAVCDYLDRRVLPSCDVEGVWDILCIANFMLAAGFLDSKDDRKSIPAKQIQEDKGHNTRFRKQNGPGPSSCSMGCQTVLKLFPGSLPTASNTSIRDSSCPNSN